MGVYTNNYLTDVLANILHNRAKKKRPWRVGDGGCVTHIIPYSIIHNHVKG